MKTNAFEITPRRVAILGWSVCLCVVFLLLQFSENYGQHIDELSADGFSVASAATDVSPLLRICGVAVAAEKFFAAVTAPCLFCRTE